MLRQHFLERIDSGFRTAKVVAILGPRQCGKTTLAREYFSKQHGKDLQYFDLEKPSDFSRLSNDPQLALERFDGLIVIDEIQLAPDLFKILRCLVDAPDPKQRYLILGSASRELIQQSSESLAGRISYLELTPFTLNEVPELDTLWLRGGFPLSYLAENEQDSYEWRHNYIRTYLEQDIPNLGIKINPQHLRRFWLMLTANHGQIFNASALGNALDISHNTAKNYLDILSGTFMVRQLHPWHENISKRQVKSRKIYFRDSGIFHGLLGIENIEQLLVNPNLGTSWEGFALEALINHLQVDQYDCYFWAVHNQAELDLFIPYKGKRLGFEFKYSKNLKITRSMHSVIESLKLDHLYIVYPGKHLAPLQEKITAIPLSELSLIPDLNK